MIACNVVYAVVTIGLTAALAEKGLVWVARRLVRRQRRGERVRRGGALPPPLGGRAGAVSRDGRRGSNVQY